MNTTKTMRKTKSTMNIFMMSQRFEEMLFRYFSSCACALSTLARVSSTFSSILIASSPCSCTCNTKCRVRI